MHINECPCPYVLGWGWLGMCPGICSSIKGMVKKIIKSLVIDQRGEGRGLNQTFRIKKKIFFHQLQLSSSTLLAGFLNLLAHSGVRGPKLVHAGQGGGREGRGLVVSSFPCALGYSKVQGRNWSVPSIADHNSVPLRDQCELVKESGKKKPRECQMLPIILYQD